MLVHPAQLRKLVRMHKEGDKVQITGMRGGEKREFDVTIGKATGANALFGEGNLPALDALRELKLELKDLPIRGELEKEMGNVRENLKNLKIDQGKVQIEIKRNLEAAQKALAEALKNAGESVRGLDLAGKSVREAEANARADKRHSVIVRSKSKDVRSVVQTDDSGTLVIVWNPKPYLTAHDKDGKLVFDGPIDTQEERDKVPADVMERVKPMLEQGNSNTDKRF